MQRNFTEIPGFTPTPGPTKFSGQHLPASLVKDSTGRGFPLLAWAVLCLSMVVRYFLASWWLSFNPFEKKIYSSKLDPPLQVGVKNRKYLKPPFSSRIGIRITSPKSSIETGGLRHRLFTILCKQGIGHRVNLTKSSCYQPTNVYQTITTMALMGWLRYIHPRNLT